MVRSNRDVSAIFTVSFILLSLLQESICGRQSFKGDPGDLGDMGLSLDGYVISNEAKSRAKRFISFPASSTLTFNNKIKVPLFSDEASTISGTFKGFVKGIYTLPSSTVTIGRSSSDIDGERYQAYNSIESIFSSFGYNGHQCLLKAICETAEDSAKDFGLIGELLTMLLSPNHGLTSYNEELKDYTAAENYGREVGNCGLAYNSCPYELNELLRTGMSILQGSVSGFAGFGF